MSLADYGLHPDIRVLGVDADMADGVRDWQHDYHSIDTVANVVPATESDALQINYNGSNSGESGTLAA